MAAEKHLSPKLLCVRGTTQCPLRRRPKHRRPPATEISHVVSRRREFVLPRCTLLNEKLGYSGKVFDFRNVRRLDRGGSRVAGSETPGRFTGHGQTGFCPCYTGLSQFHCNAHDTRSRNRRQKPAPENWRRFLAPVFHVSCKISGARNQHGRIKK